jgi:hypothetical protein
MFTQLDFHLRRFLWERNLWWRFNLNLIICTTSLIDYIRLRKSLSITKPHAILLAFDWCNTMEGEAFWNSIDRKWQIHYGFLLSGGYIEPYN